MSVCVSGGASEEPRNVVTWLHPAFIADPLRCLFKKKVQLEFLGFRDGSVHLNVCKDTHTNIHTPRDCLSTPCPGLTAVQGCRIQTTQISCRIGGLQQREVL